MLDYQKLLNFFDEYISHYRELLRFETEKLRLIAEDDLKGLENCIGREQALVMKTNAFEKKRLELMPKEKTFKAIIDEAPIEFKAQLEARYLDLSKAVLKVKEINDSAKDVITKKLAFIEKAINGTSSQTYDKSGAKSASKGVFASLDKDV